LRAAADGTLWLTGSLVGTTVFGPGQGTETSLDARNTDIYLLKLAADGALSWTRRDGGADIDTPTAVFPGADGGALVAGRIFATATFGESTANPVTLLASSREGVVARYAADGELAWVRRAGGSSLDEANAVVELSDRTSIAVGHFNRTAMFGLGESNQQSLTSAGEADVWIARLAE
jgi:hypothetical protein